MQPLEKSTSALRQKYQQDDYVLFFPKPLVS